MKKCGRLTHANNLYAWFDNSRKEVTLAADVALNPFTTEAEICPNPLSRLTPPPDAREFLVEAIETAHGPVTPQLEVIKRVFFSFAADATPAKVRFYVAGVDNPVIKEVAVTNQPPPPLQAQAGTSAGAGKATSGASRERIEGRGWSDTYSFEEALHNALSDLRSKIPPGVQNPDVGISADVFKMTAHGGGNIRPGLELIVKG